MNSLITELPGKKSDEWKNKIPEFSVIWNYFQMWKFKFQSFVLLKKKKLKLKFEKSWKKIVVIVFLNYLFIYLVLWFFTFFYFFFLPSSSIFLLMFENMKLNIICAKKWKEWWWGGGKHLFVCLAFLFEIGKNIDEKKFFDFIKMNFPFITFGFFQIKVSQKIPYDSSAY